MDWSEFSRHLRVTLPRITDRCFLVIADPIDNGYVQFAGSDDLLDAEAAGPEFVTGDAAHGVDDERMRALGWATPSRSQPNWSCTIPLPALSTEFGVLAERCTAALRDVHHVDGPDVLSYRAWREREVQPPGVTWPAERFDQLDPGENPLLLPSLGLPYRSTPAP